MEKLRMWINIHFKSKCIQYEIIASQTSPPKQMTPCWQPINAHSHIHVITQLISTPHSLKPAALLRDGLRDGLRDKPLP